MSTWTYRADQEFPSFSVAWYDGTGNLIDFSTGWTFEVKVGSLTKTTGITGSASAPNVVVAWGAGELNITPGTYPLYLKATSSGGDRRFRPGNEPEIEILATPS